jgi:uncharacterized membrane protein
VWSEQAAFSWSGGMEMLSVESGGGDAVLGEDQNARLTFVPAPNISRCHYVDFLRGIAIIIMLQANLVPYVDHARAPLALRMIYSLAAPTFIFLSGFSATKFSSSNRSVPLSSSSSSTFPLPFSVQRVLFSAIFIDVAAWILYPFQTFDVLYLISLNLFTIHHLLPLDLYWSLFLFVTISLFWIVYLFIGSYRFHISSLSISQTEPFSDYLLNCVRCFFFDGWFPFFPWILIGWLGSFQVRIPFFQNTISFKIAVTIISLATTLIYLLLAPSAIDPNTNSSSPTSIGFDSGYNHEDRDGYEELFYPVTLLYFIWSSSTVITAMFILEQLETFIEQTQLYNPLCLIGRNSLLVYLLHSFFISYVIIFAQWPSIAIHQNWFGYLFLLLFVVSLVYAKEYFIKEPKKVPTIVRFLTGI